MAGRMINGAAALAELVRSAEETETPGVHRMLPVVPELSHLLPGRGLRRGSTVAVATGRAAPASGGTSLLLALLAEASRAGSWCAVVGVPTLGALAAAESGIALDRLALVPNPGPDWPTVVAALIDGVDMVVTAVPGGVSAAVASRLVARARQRGSVLIPFGPWSGADVTLRVVEGRWEGLGPGHGRLRRRTVTVVAQGRGAATRPKEATMWMPGFSIRPLDLPPPPPTGDDEERKRGDERGRSQPATTRPEGAQPPGSVPAPAMSPSASAVSASAGMPSLSSSATSSGAKDARPSLSADGARTSLTWHLSSSERLSPSFFLLALSSLARALPPLPSSSSVGPASSAGSSSGPWPSSFSASAGRSRKRRRVGAGRACEVVMPAVS